MFIPAGSVVLSALSTLSGLAAIPAQRPSTSPSDIALEPRDFVTETAYITIPNYATTMTKTWATKPRKPQSDIPGYVDRTELNVEYTKPLSNALRHHTVNEFDPRPTTWRGREKSYDLSSSEVTSTASQDNEKRAEQTVALPVTETRTVSQILIARSEVVGERMTAICHQPPLGIGFCEYSIVDDGKAKREVAAKTTMSLEPTKTPGDDPEEEVVTVTTDSPDVVVTVTEHEETETVWATTTTEAPEKTVTAPSTTEFVDEREETGSASSSTIEDTELAYPKTTKGYSKKHATAPTQNARPSSSPSSKKTSSFSDRRSKKPKSTSTSPSASTAAFSDSTSVPLSILPGSPLALKWSPCHRGPLSLCLPSASSGTRDVDADAEIVQANHDDGMMYHPVESRRPTPGTVSSSSATASTTATVPPTPDSDLFAFLPPAPSSSSSSAMVTQKPNLTPDVKIVTATVTMTSSSFIKTRNDEEIDDFFGQQFWTVPKSFTLTGSRTV